MEIKAQDMLDIYNLLSSYAEILDFGEWDRVSEFITEDFHYDLSDMGLEPQDTLEGTRKAWSTFTNYYVHVVANPRIIGYDGKRAEVHSRCIGVIQSGLSDAAHYVDEMVKTDKGWRIKHRAITIIKNGATMSLGIMNQVARPHAGGVRPKGHLGAKAK
jgi:3-phenylpropionate/cinnamic acid dioxygenase small subunit